MIPQFLLDKIEAEDDRVMKTLGVAENCDIREELSKQIAQRVACEWVIEQLVKADNGVLALIVVEGQGLRKRRDERDTEFVKRIVKNYNELIVGTLAYDLLGWKT